MISIEMASNHKYEATAKGVMMWAASELEHVGRIVGIKDKDIQYSYAMSTLNGMAHLKDALFELVNDPAYENHKQDLLRVHDTVIRVMKHLVKDFDLDLNAIRMFNQRKILSNLSYLNDENASENANNNEYESNESNGANSVSGGKRRRATRKNRKSLKGSRKSRKNM
jgi:hypothetical protein